jgi:hypothetical protein
VLVQPDRQSDVQGVAAAHVNRQPLQRCSQADVIESRRADILTARVRRARSSAPITSRA